MADTTPIYGFPFLELGDPPDLASGLEDLATAVEADLAATNTALDARLDALEATPAWTSYTPTWTATANPAIGNGSLTGAYRQIGKKVTFRIRMLAGSTTTFGTGAYVLTYPVTAKVLQNPSITGWFLQGSTPNGVVAIGFSTTTFRMLTMSSNSFAGPTVPFTLANGNEFNIGGTYEAA